MKIIKEYLLITLGVAIVAFALEYFFFTNNIASGGVAGLALIIQSIFDIDAGVIMTVCNVILFILAFKFVGGGFGLKSIYAAFGVSTILSVIEQLNIGFAITNNLMLASIFGSALLAIGSTIVFNQGASTGGTSITAKLLNKYCHIDIGKGMLISDSVVIVLAIFNFGIELGLFGLFSVYLAGTLVDKFVEGFKSCKQVMVFTEKEELVVNYIMKDIDRGCTVFNGKGGYSGKNNSVIFTVLGRREFIQLKQFVREKDPDAFITVNEATEVLGKGFVALEQE